MKPNINPNIIGSADKWALQTEKGLIANNERVLFAVAELRLPELKDEGLLCGEYETDYLSGS